MTTTMLPVTQVLTTTADVLLADVAIRVQLSPTAYDKAVARHDAIKRWIERGKSPLHGCVEHFYPQGSMATRSTIASKLRTDEFDIDIVAALLLAADTPAAEVLDLLYEAIRAEPGSRYFDVAERRTRCITVHYADGMHLDVTPLLRRPATPERESWLFHHRERTPRELGERLIANPYGFAAWFNERMPVDHDFAQMYEARSIEYERTVLAGIVDDDPVPPQEHPGRKSMAVIVLQLLKRWRNVQYDLRTGRRPPSILMSKLVADNAGHTETLSRELLYQSRRMLEAFEYCQAVRKPIHVENPTCPADVLTDRWPASMSEQAQFIEDLRELVKDVERLVEGCRLDEIKEILTKLFGEEPTGAAVDAYAERIGESIRTGNGRHQTGSGRIVVPAATVAGVTALPTPVRATPPHKFHGDRWKS